MFTATINTNTYNTTMDFDTFEECFNYCLKMKESFKYTGTVGTVEMSFEISDEEIEEADEEYNLLTPTAEDWDEINNGIYEG